MARPTTGSLRRVLDAAANGHLYRDGLAFPTLNRSLIRRPGQRPTWVRPALMRRVEARGLIRCGRSAGAGLRHWELTDAGRAVVQRRGGRS